MHWTFIALFLTALEVTENGAVPLLIRKRIKNFIDNNKIGVDKWTLALPTGENVEETANIVERMRKIIIRSNNLPDTSGMDNSTVLMDFKKGVFAVLFLDTDLGPMCFLRSEKSSFAESVAEIKRRKNAQTSVQQGEPIVFYAFNKHKITNSRKLLRIGGAAVLKMCRRSIENGRVFLAVKDITESMTPYSFTASGFISPLQPGKSVPIVFKMEENTTGDGVQSSTSSSVAN